MSDNEEGPEEKVFAVDKAKNGRAGCKKCKQKCPSGELRIAKLTYNPFAGGKMKNWHHIDCIFEAFLKQRPTTKRIDSIEDIDGIDDISDDDRKLIEEKIEESERNIAEKYNLKTPVKKKPEKKPKDKPLASTSKTKDEEINEKDGLFREFCRLVVEVTNVSSYTEKTSLVTKLFTKGTDGVKFTGDVKLWCRLLLPGVVKRVYNLQSKQIVKLFSKIFKTDQDDMFEHLESGDVSETILHFFEKSKAIKQSKKSELTLIEVDDFLQELSGLTKEEEQIHHIKKFVPKCTGNDLKFVIRLIKHDLKMNAGAKHILEGVHPDAYEVFQTSRDIDAVLDRCLSNKGTKASVKAKVSIMTPVLPMLAEACRSVEQAMKKCPNGMYSEIKYDGERVQVHKQGSEFRYFSRSLKPVMPHKVKHFEEYIPKAFPHGKDLILDSEILMVDVNTGKPLPFGTLGSHKQDKFKNANVCLFVFDCIYYNGDDLTSTPLKKRKSLLKEVMTEIPNRIVFSELEEIHQKNDLRLMIAKVLQLGLEGLVLKDLKSVYEPGKRHWLKVKKDYLFDGAMADTADLIVLGAWYGTGKKGGMMSVFLMGCYDENKKRFCTVTKVHTGHDDNTLERLQDELDMIKISGDAGKVPDWLKCTKTMIPDFVAKDPENQPVWEITGAEFTQQHDVHTADGISIRFPRVTRIRDDKTWKTATNLSELKKLFKESKENTDVSLLLKNSQEPYKNDDCLDEMDDTPSPKKQKKYSESPKKGNKRKSEDDYKNSRNGKTAKIKNPLPDIFDKINLLIGDNEIDDVKKWLRHFIAYGGTVVDENDREMATHVLYSGNEDKSGKNRDLKKVKHVSVQWIKDCVSKGDILDDRRYRVIEVIGISDEGCL